jgi:hypothetical protein
MGERSYGLEVGFLVFRENSNGVVGQAKAAQCPAGRNVVNCLGRTTSCVRAMLHKSKHSQYYITAIGIPSICGN